MRGLVFAALPLAAAVAAASATALVACFDLFHSTRDVLTACEINALTPDCGAGERDALSASGGDAGETDFCAWSPEEARTNARRACAWLAACQTPMGRNAFGSCLFDALLAYDCAANPNHRVKGNAHGLWDCLWRVNDCDDVRACVFPDGPPAACESGKDYTACGVTTVDGATNNIDVRIEYSDGSAHGENCALWGQTCATDGGSHACAGAGGLGCGARECVKGVEELVWCVAGGNDIGINCANNGAQKCLVLPDDAQARYAVCMPESDAEDCVPDATAACIDGTAVSCASGRWERIDCASLLEWDAACNPGPLAPPFDWTSTCALTAPQCDADECTEQGGLAGCVRGATMAQPVDCAEAGLGACRAVSTDKGRAWRATCAPPQ